LLGHDLPYTGTVLATCFFARQKLLSSSVPAVRADLYRRHVHLVLSTFLPSPNPRPALPLCRRYRNNRRSPRECLALPKLWRGDDHPAEIHGCRTVSMRSLRFFLRAQPMCPSDVLQHVDTLLCPSPAHRPPPIPFTTVSAAIFRNVDHLPRSHSVAEQHAASVFSTKLPFNPHNSTRPPQPPAASF
jgi:hypothetical protein